MAKLLGGTRIYGTATIDTNLIVGGVVTATNLFVGPWPVSTGTSGGGVTSIVAGTNITISPSGGTGAVTINSSGGGGAAIPVLNDTSTSVTYYPALSSITTGTLSTATVSSTKLYFVPSTGTLNATIFNSLSDITQKSNISVISNGLEIVESLRGVTFDWADGSGSSAGLLAQEVEQWLPQLVSTGPNGVKNLNYSGVIGALVEAVKTLSDRVKILESK